MNFKIISLNDLVLPQVKINNFLTDAKLSKTGRVQSTGYTDGEKDQKFEATPCETFLKNGILCGLDLGLNMPLLVLRTRVQMGSFHLLKQRSFSNVLKHGWTGFGSTFAAFAPSYAFTGVLKESISKSNLVAEVSEKHRETVSTFAASITVASGWTVVFDGLATRQQADVQMGIHKSLAETARDLYKEGGFRRFYKGVSLTVARDTPFFFTYMQGIPLLKSKMPEAFIENNHITSNVLASSPLAFATAYATNGTEWIRTRYQMNPEHPNFLKTISEGVKQLLKEPHLWTKGAGYRGLSYTVGGAIYNIFDTKIEDALKFFR